MKLQSEFSREFLKTIFVRLPHLASAARCGPHPSLGLCKHVGAPVIDSHWQHADGATGLPSSNSSCQKIRQIALNVKVKFSNKHFQLHHNDY